MEYFVSGRYACFIFPERYAQRSPLSSLARASIHSIKGCRSSLCLHGFIRLTLSCLVILVSIRSGNFNVLFSPLRGKYLSPSSGNFQWCASVVQTAIVPERQDIRCESKAKRQKYSYTLFVHENNGIHSTSISTDSIRRINYCINSTYKLLYKFDV